ncbi:MAG: hypothetical protein GQ525_03295 [Draconibacterium sp.]|nr:hypothetical protein [Draconibacterium sp.]
MKTLKFIFASLFVLSFFFISTDLNAQEKWGKSGKFEVPYTFICPCAGEFLQGIIVFQVNDNGKVANVTLKGRKLIGIEIGGFDENGDPTPSGVPSGNRYMFTRVDHINSNTGSEVWTIRTVRLGDGIVTRNKVYFQDGVFIGADVNCM